MTGGRIKTIFLLLVTTIPFSESHSQSDSKLGSWYIYNGFFNFSPKVELFFETQLRLWETFNNPETFFVRPYFNYNIHPNFQTGIGLEYHNNQTYAEDPDDRRQSTEYRLTMQGMAYQNIGRVALQHRYRYEFRNISTGNRQRTRYRIQATIPINKKEADKGVFFANTFNEFLIETEPTLQFDQNRFYIAGGYHFSKYLNFQFGYLFISREETTHKRLQFFLTQKLFFYEK
jgi:hypothetical protein